jgi:hypothetical protein
MEMVLACDGEHHPPVAAAVWTNGQLRFHNRSVNPAFNFDRL